MLLHKPTNAAFVESSTFCGSFIGVSSSRTVFFSTETCSDRYTLGTSRIAHRTISAKSNSVCCLSSDSSYWNNSSTFLNKSSIRGKISILEFVLSAKDFFVANKIGKCESVLQACRIWIFLNTYLSIIIIIILLQLAMAMTKSESVLR